MQVQNVAIIGAGAAGLAAAKYFIAERAFRKIVVFEQRSQVGGIWLYTPEVNQDESFSIPQTDPSGSVETPVWRTIIQSSHTGSPSEDEKARGTSKMPIFVSPVYDRLETNIPRSLMRFSDLDFPDNLQLFPEHHHVLQYLEKYAKDVESLVRFATQVTRLSLIPMEGSQPKDKWSLSFVDLMTGVSETEIFDAVAVASGHYNLPYVPEIEGIREWNKLFPNSMSHSKYFRRPDDFVGKKVVVVGNSASGLEIGEQISTVCKLPLLQSRKTESYLSIGPSPNKLELPPIVALHPPERAVRFANGHIESDVDCIVFCTGYFYSFPFMSKDLQGQMIDDGTRVCNTYQHLFFAPHPTLSLLALPQKIIPFPVSEVQSAVVARVYSGRLSLPTLSEMQAWEEEVSNERGFGGGFHTLQFPKDANYINELHDWAMTAVRRDGLENEGNGKIPPMWGDWERRCRERFPAIRGAFLEKGENKSRVRTLEELGIHL